MSLSPPSITFGRALDGSAPAPDGIDAIQPGDRAGLISRTNLVLRPPVTDIARKIVRPSQPESSEAPNELSNGIHASCRPEPPAPTVPSTPGPQGAQTPKVGQPISCEPTYGEAAKRVLSKVKFFDEKLHDHQNALLEENPRFREEMERHKGVGVTYIHVDTHSDIYKSDLPSWISIANHLPLTILKNPEITDVYWVTKPEVIKLSENNRRDREAWLLVPEKDIRVFVPKNYNRFSKLFYEPLEGAPEDLKNYRIVTIRRRQVDELPDFKGKPVIANLDSDYFSNTGYDTTGRINHKFKESEVASFFESLDSKHVRPFAVLTCLSPGYTPVGDVRIRQLSSDLETYSGKRDLYATYARPDPKYGDSFGGRNIFSEDNKLYVLARELLKLDLNTKAPDANIALDLKNNPELKSAVLKTKEVYHLTSDEEAIFILRQLDVKDGVKDNVVNIWNWHESSFFKRSEDVKPGELKGLESVFQFEDSNSGRGPRSPE